MIRKWLEILSADNDFCRIEKIKEKLEILNPSLYEEWKEADFDVNHIVNHEKCTLLHLAASTGYTKVAKAIIENGASVNIVDDYGRTPLHLATWSGYTEIAEILIEKGANVNVIDDKCKKTPLHLAAEKGYTEIVNALIDNNADINALDGKKLPPLHFAAKNGHKGTVDALMDKGANPLLGNKNRTLKHLAELNKQVKKEQRDDRYESLKHSLLCRGSYSLVDIVGEDTFDDLTCRWFSDVSGLTLSQKELNKELLSILQSYLSSSDEGDYGSNGYIVRLEKFLLDNKNNQDLEIVLNFRRGESKLTVLHAISSIAWIEKEYDDSVDLLLKAGAKHDIKDDKGRTPLHYATDFGSISSLLQAGADLSICDKQGKTPLDIAIDNHNYSVEGYLLINEQERLQQELHDILYDDDMDEDNFSSLNEGLTKLRKFLNTHKNTKNLKRILNLHDNKGKSQIFQCIKSAFDGNGACYKEAEKLLLAVGAKDFEGLNNKESLLKSRLWYNLIPDQQRMLKTFLDKVDAVQNMNQLEEIVNEAIKYRVRFNFPNRGNLYGKAYESKYSFMDYVIKRISELEKSSRVASNIVCNLISRGAVLYNVNSMNILNTLELELEDHKTNMIIACENYTNLTLKFMEVVKSATTGKVKDVKVDNSTFYLEYSEDSTIDVAKITDGERDLWLTQEEIEYGRDIIKIGKSEVEIIIENGIRHYTDLADNSNIVLTFYTSLGEVDVRLYTDVQDKSKIIVEVSNKNEILKKFKDCEEELGEDCSLGGYWVYDAIEQGYFERSGGLMRSEVISESNKQKGSWVERIDKDSRRGPDFRDR